jgi:hypothetical protein
MICDICHNEYAKSCAHCSRRVNTWGIEGTYNLYNLAKREQNIEVSELKEFVDKYYIGKTRGFERVIVLKISLKIAGYKGNFIGRYGIDKNDYSKYKYAQTTLGYRWRLRRDVCDYCDETSGLILHHIVPTSWGGITSDENCITVCHSHHKAIHRELKKHLNRMRILEYIRPHQEEINELAYKSIDIVSI